MSHKLRCAFMVLIMFGTSCLPVSASFCHRHFYNNSNYPWTVVMGPPNGCGNGSIIVHSCTVRPHTTLALHYNSIIPANGITISSPVYKGEFVVTIDCKIQHRGRTGNAYVNEPANGDVTTCSGKC